MHKKNNARKGNRTPNENTNDREEAVYRDLASFVGKFVRDTAELYRFSAFDEERFRSACSDAIRAGTARLDDEHDGFFRFLRQRLVWKRNDFVDSIFRHPERHNALSLYGAPDDDDEEGHSRNYVAETELPMCDAAGVPRDLVDEYMRAAEIRAVLDTLTPGDLAICIAVLLEGSVNAASEALGYPRGSRYVDRRIRKIRARFVAAGLEPEGRRATSGFEPRKPSYLTV